MATDTRTFEQSVVDMTVRTTKEFSGRLQDVRLSVRSGLRKEFKNGLLDAELSLSFYRDNDFVDALETFVIKKGAPTVSLTDLEPWLRDGIQDVVSTQAI